MKKNNLKKFLSAAAVLAVSATATLSAIPFAACTSPESSVENEKLITADKNHSAHMVSTANGVVRTESSGTVYYVSPDGNRGNDGLSWDKPQSIADLLSDPDVLKPGDTVYVKPGRYEITATVTMPENVKGEYNKYIRIVNAALERDGSHYDGNETLCTLDFSKQFFASTARGVQLYGDFIYWYGIDVCGAGDNGLYIGGSYNTVEYCEFYNNRDTGLQLGRTASTVTSIENWPSYNLVKNCTSHNNYDNETYGENADGFAAKLTVGYGNVFDGCIAYRNSDDGWDLYAKSDSGNIGCVIIYNCVAFENGYLEYTQKENNARFPNYNKEYDEKFDSSTKERFYLTRDGDGNGFKLGGSVMEGDVVMYNCLSYMNRMHGVTDNSNPGFLKVEGVTSYDNSAIMDDDPESPTFGQIVSTLATYKDASDHDQNWYKQEEHGNIDVSRQVYSYNSVINTLSVKSSYMSYLTSDAYRGSVTDSMLVASKQNVVEGSIDADSKKGKSSTSTRDLLVPSDVFKALPLYYTTEGEAQVAHYNLSGLKTLYAADGSLKADRVHKAYRNEDGSVNMHDILAKKDGVDESKLLVGKNIGAKLNLGSYDAYDHFYANDYVNENASKADQAKLERIIETLTINCDNNAVYQDFEVPVKMKDCTITWTSANDEVAEIGKDVEQSVSTSQYINIIVNRPLDEDVKVTITAHITSGTAEGTKDFELTIKAGKPSIGAISVETRDGDVLREGESLVIDQYSIFTDPVISVENGLDYNGKLLRDDQFSYTTKYMYAPDKNSPSVEIAGFTPSNAGVYTITHTVKLTSDATVVKTMTYTLFVASSTGNVDFVNNSNKVVVNRDGFFISGNLSNATGYIYAVATTSETKPTAATIKNFDGVQYFSYRNDAIKFQFAEGNSGAYTIYYALGNLNGDITSEVYEQDISLVEISDNASFMKIAGGDKIGNETPSTTIYKLTTDLDFAETTWSANSNSFTGLLNGAGHTVKNVTVSGKGLFAKVEGATIENIKFHNISITSNTQQTGIISTLYGGYIHNIALTDIKVVGGGQRTGGLIGHLYESELPTYVSQISLVNSEERDEDGNLKYYISSGTAQRAGGIIGFIQTTPNPTMDMIVYVSDCYVIANISGLEHVGGIVGCFDNAKTTIYYLLDITRCYFAGVCSSTGGTPRVGGILGYQGGAVGDTIITRCISLGKLYTKGVLVDASLKTASPIFGGYASNAVNTVNNCIAMMDEYNSDYQVEVFSADNLKANIAEIELVLGDGYEGKWSFVYDEENENRLVAPYLVLNFLN